MVDEVVVRLRALLAGDIPDWFVVCGSGIASALASASVGLDLRNRVEISLAELGLPVPAVAGHGHTVVAGRVGTNIVALQTGRLHPYEGYPLDVCTSVLAAALKLGVRGVILTCAAGGLANDLTVGQVVAISDHIGLFGPTPLVGPTFVNCGNVYSSTLRERLAGKTGARLREVVYVHAPGPQYETPAECEALRRLGGDVVGMSTTYEAVLAASFAVPVCGLAVITNVAGAASVSHDDVQMRVLDAGPRVRELVGTLVASDPAGLGGS